MNQDAVQQLTNNNLIDLMSRAGDDHLEDGNEEARKVDRISKSGGFKAIETTLAYVAHERDVTATYILLVGCWCALTAGKRKQAW
jgi:hypothetical protein